MKIAFAVFLLLLIGGGGFSSPAFCQTSSKSARISVVVMPHFRLHFTEPHASKVDFHDPDWKRDFFDSVGLHVEDNNPEPRQVHIQEKAGRVKLTLLDPL